MESILTSIKKLLGPTQEYTHFDPDIIIHINSVFSILKQMGVGPSEGFKISDEFATWNNFISPDDNNFEFVKTYVYLKVKLVFDPPTNASVLTSIKEEIKELEWRLTSASDLNN